MKRYFVAIGKDGLPVSHRATSGRTEPYRSSPGNGSYSKKPPGVGDLVVIEVAKPLSWVAKAPVPSGCAVKRSGSEAPGQFFIKYRITGPARLPIDGVTWNYPSAEDYLQRNRKNNPGLTFEILESGPAVVELKNWPQQAVQS